MTTTRTATWTNIGANITEATTVEEALKLSHLDYTVEKVPVYLAGAFSAGAVFIWLLMQFA